MQTTEFFFTQQARTALQDLIRQVQEVSLIAAERVRSRIFHKLHLIHHQPLQASRKADFAALEGHFRVATALNYKIYYKVEDTRIVVLDFILDKEMTKPE